MRSFRVAQTMIGMLLMCMVFLWSTGCDDPPGPGHLVVSITGFNPGDLEISQVSVQPLKLEGVYSETVDGEQEVVLLGSNSDVSIIELPIGQARFSIDVFAGAVRSGYYHQFRLVTPDGVVKSIISPQGEILTIPSGMQTGIKVNPEDGEPFHVRPDGITEVEVLFDAGKQIHAPGCGFNIVTRSCRANPPPRGNPGRETPGGNHVFPDFKMKPTLLGRVRRSTGTLEGQFPEDEVFVMFKTSTSDSRIDEIVDDVNGVVVRRSRRHPWITIQLPTDSNEAQIVDELDALSEVAVASRNYFTHTINALPTELNTPSFPYDPYWLTRTKTDEAFDITLGDSTPIIAVVDGELFPNTPDLQDRVFINVGEVPTSRLVNDFCVDLQTPVVLLPETDNDNNGSPDFDRNGDGVITSEDWDVDGNGLTLSDFNEPNNRGFINTELGRPLDTPVLIRDLINPSPGRCGLFETARDSDDNGHPDDLVGWDFVDDDNWPADDLSPIPGAVAHGTAVAAVAAASINEESVLPQADLVDYVGVAPRARTLMIRVLTKDFEQEIGAEPDSVTADNIRRDQVMDSLSYAVDLEADVINMSWSELCGPTGKDAVPDRLECDGTLRARKLQKMEDAFAVAGLDNPVLVVGGVNEGQADLDAGDIQDLPTELGLPNLIAVNASDEDDNITLINGKVAVSFGNSTYDLSAPGKDLYLLDGVGAQGNAFGFAEDNNGDAPEPKSGNSFAAPQVAGAAALMLSQCPSLRGNPVEIKQRIVGSADCGLGGLTSYNIGGCRLNVAAAVRSVTPSEGGTCP